MNVTDNDYSCGMIGGVLLDNRIACLVLTIMGKNFILSSPFLVEIISLQQLCRKLYEPFFIECTALYSDDSILASIYSKR